MKLTNDRIYAQQAARPSMSRIENPQLLLQRRPAVHLLCSQAFLQEPVWISETEDLAAIPLKPLGYEAEAHYTAFYADDAVDATVEQHRVEELIEQGSEAGPVIALVSLRDVWASPEVLENSARSVLERGRKIISWVSGNEVNPFAMVTATNQTSFRVIPPRSKKRRHLGPIGSETPGLASAMGETMQNIFTKAQQNEHFAFALSMFHDAVREENPRFKIARCFACLESLAYKLKDGQGSRKAIKKMIGLEDGDTVNGEIEGFEYSYDDIEIAGRIRNKLFHGVPFEKEHLIEEAYDAYYIYENHPEHIANGLQSRCEIEIARWANGESRGIPEAE